MLVFNQLQRILENSSGCSHIGEWPHLSIQNKSERLKRLWNSFAKGKKASEIFNVFKPTKQLLENVTVKDKSIIDTLKCKNAIKKASKIIKKQGRILVRKSGTEPKIRIMVETDNKKLLLNCINIVKRSLN